MNTYSHPRTIERVITDSITLTTPTHRLLLLACSYCPEDDPTPYYHEQHPVVALRSAVVRRYARRGTDAPRLPDTDHKALLADGWNYRGQDVTSTALVAPGRLDLPEIAAAEDLSASNTVIRVITALWPAEEDTERLAGVRLEMEQEAREQEERDRRSEAAEDVPEPAPATDWHALARRAK